MLQQTKKSNIMTQHSNLYWIAAKTKLTVQHDISVICIILSSYLAEGQNLALSMLFLMRITSKYPTCNFVYQQHYNKYRKYYRYREIQIKKSFKKHYFPSWFITFYIGKSDRSSDNIYICFKQIYKWHVESTLSWITLSGKYHMLHFSLPQNTLAHLLKWIRNEQLTF